MRQPSPQQQQEATMAAKRAETRRRSPAPGPPGRIWRERQWSSGRRSHTGAQAQLEWPRGPGGVRGEQPDFSPRQTLSPRPWLPLVEPGQEQSSREPGNKDARLQEGEGVRGQRTRSPQLISDPNGISPFAAAGQGGAGITQQEACALPTRLCHWR